MLRNSVSATANEKNTSSFKLSQSHAGGGVGKIINLIRSVSKTEKYPHEIIAWRNESHELSEVVAS